MLSIMAPAHAAAMLLEVRAALNVVSNAMSSVVACSLLQVVHNNVLLTQVRASASNVSACCSQSFVVLLALQHHHALHCIQFIQTHPSSVL